MTTLRRWWAELNERRTAEILASSRPRFVWVHGVLGFGVLMAVVMPLVNRLVDRSPLDTRSWALSFAAFLPAGALYGWIVWTWTKRCRDRRGRQ
jgi:hypothetical protein